MTQFLEHCATGTNAVTGETGTRLDLVTFHAKGGVAITSTTTSRWTSATSSASPCRLRSGRGLSPDSSRTPIYITEADPDGCAACPASSIAGTAYRNSTAYGAYEIAMMKRTLELEAEVGVKLGGCSRGRSRSRNALFAGYRALATNGIDLPVLSAFKLLGAWRDRLPLTSSGAHALDDILANGVRGTSQTSTAWPRWTAARSGSWCGTITMIS